MNTTEPSCIYLSSRELNEAVSPGFTFLHSCSVEQVFERDNFTEWGGEAKYVLSAGKNVLLIRREQECDNAHSVSLLSKLPIHSLWDWTEIPEGWTDGGTGRGSVGEWGLGFSKYISSATSSSWSSTSELSLLSDSLMFWWVD